jgi:hypothetical protein
MRSLDVRPLERDLATAQPLWRRATMAFLQAASTRTQLVVVVGVALALTAAIILMNVWFHSTPTVPWSAIVPDTVGALGFLRILSEPGGQTTAAPTSAQ